MVFVEVALPHVSAQLAQLRDAGRCHRFSSCVLFAVAERLFHLYVVFAEKIFNSDIPIAHLSAKKSLIWFLT